MIPSIGRIVHYRRNDGEAPLPAIILEVQGDVLHLDVFVREGVEYVTSKSMAAGPKEAVAGEWWWAERI